MHLKGLLVQFTPLLTEKKDEKHVRFRDASAASMVPKTPLEDGAAMFLCKNLP